MVTGAEPVCTADLLAILPALTDHIVDMVIEKQNAMVCVGSAGAQTNTQNTTFAAPVSTASGGADYYQLSGGNIVVKQAGGYNVKVRSSAYVLVGPVTSSGACSCHVSIAGTDRGGASALATADESDSAVENLDVNVSLQAGAVIAFSGQSFMGSTFSASFDFTISKIS